MSWLGFNGSEIEELCFKSQQMSIQRGIKTHGDKGKQSAMKETQNLALKMNVLGRLNAIHLF